MILIKINEVYKGEKLIKLKKMITVNITVSVCTFLSSIFDGSTKMVN